MTEAIHPGTTVKTVCEKNYGPLNVTKLAECLDVSRNTVSMIINGRRGISAEMAVRLSIVLGGTARSWLELQATYELALAYQNYDEITKELKPYAKESS